MTIRKRKSIRWHHAARDDFAAIIDRIAQVAPRRAERFGNKLLKKIELLENFPHLGPVCLSYRQARFLVHGNYVVYYTVHRREVVIRAVVQGARLFRSWWLGREE